jgi:hypothetical protein
LFLPPAKNVFPPPSPGKKFSPVHINKFLWSGPNRNARTTILQLMGLLKGWSSIARGLKFKATTDPLQMKGIDSNGKKLVHEIKAIRRAVYAMEVEGT